MKIAVRGGHNFSVPGANGIISETKEDRNMKNSFIKYLKAAGHEVLDVTPPDSCNSIMSDLKYGVDKANNWGADLYIPIHFNNCYNHYDGALGAEVYVYKDSFAEANNIMKALAEIGFKNRGVKSDPRLYDLRRSNMKAALIEVCFVESTVDVALYKKVGYDEISRRIVEKMFNKSIASSGNSSSSSSSNTNTSKPSNAPKKLWEVSIHGEIVERLQRELNRQCGAGIAVDGWFGTNTLDHCILVRQGASGNITKIIQERLDKLGYNIGQWGYTGNFGDYTYRAVRAFQKDRKLSVDGIVGRETWRELFAK